MLIFIVTVFRVHEGKAVRSFRLLVMSEDCNPYDTDRRIYDSPDTHPTQTAKKKLLPIIHYFFGPPSPMRRQLPARIPTCRNVGASVATRATERSQQKTEEVLETEKEAQCTHTYINSAKQGFRRLIVAWQ